MENKDRISGVAAAAFLQLTQAHVQRPSLRDVTVYDVVRRFCHTRSEPMKLS